MREKMNSSSQKWKHPGGKLRELGPESLTDTELLAIGDGDAGSDKLLCGLQVDGWRGFIRWQRWD